MTQGRKDAGTFENEKLEMRTRALLAFKERIMITEINTNMKLSEHFTLAELTKTKTGIENVPNEE